MFGSSQAFQNSQDQTRLMDEGMTCAEAANALDAANAEGRRVGSAAEERQRTLDRAAQERRARAISGSGALAVEPGTKNLLIIDGTGVSTDFMSEHLLMLERERTPGFFEMPKPPEEKRANEAAWRGLRHERIGLECGERPDRLELCRRAIASGRFHAIILSDLSENHRAVPAVEHELGPTLQRFVHGGGAIAVTTCDAAMALPMLQRLFRVTWKMGGYYRTMWSPARENTAVVTRTFPGELATGSFSAKAHAVCHVPEHERLYGTTPDSRTQSNVPFMAGRDVGTRDDADSVTSAAAEDYDVVCARHTYGEGSIALFCDINMESATVQRVLGYCRLCTPDVPADAVALLDEPSFASAMSHKTQGTAAFGAQSFGAAAEAYEAALAMYQERGGARGVQREEKIRLCSNLAECRLKLGHWEEAAHAASEALALEPAHAKSLVRRAKAADKLGDTEAAVRDLRRVTGSATTPGVGEAAQVAAAAALLRPIEARLREAKRDARRQESARQSTFRSGFARALGSGGQQTDPMDVSGHAPPPPAGANPSSYEDKFNAAMAALNRAQPSGASGSADDSEVMALYAGGAQYLTGKKQPAALSTSTRDDEDLPDVYDKDGVMYCAHGLESCHLCGTDLRLQNEERRAELRDENLDVVRPAIERALRMRQEKEQDLLGRLHMERGGGPHLDIGTQYSHGLMLEVQQRYAEQLPMWPPPLRKGTQVRISGVQSRPELNNQAGRVEQYIPSTGRYHVRLDAPLGPDDKPISLKRANLQLRLVKKPHPLAFADQPITVDDDMKEHLAFLKEHLKSMPTGPP